MSAANWSPKRWRIASIRVAHFRGIDREQVFEFNGLPGLLHGKNGVGKSTVALALQWVLYGEFPSGVLQKVSPDTFLLPVGAKSKASCSGEVVFSRGKERLVVSRQGKQFSLVSDGKKYSGDEAAAQRDELLGTDLDTFVRAVLLQQSRVRGLLMDAVAERNRCLDRLIGMEDVEELLEIVKSRPFTDAAKDCRAQLKLEQQKLEQREKLLGEQLEEAQQRARELKFLNKDLNPTGLKTRYAELGGSVVELAKKHGVAVEALPACESPLDAPKVVAAFHAAVRAIRTKSELKVRLAPIETAIATLTSFQQRWVSQSAAVGKALQAVTAAVEQHGDRKKLLSDVADAKSDADRARDALKRANELRELLSDALDYAQREEPSACPVCEQKVAAPPALAERLTQRVAALASDEIVKLDELRNAAEKRVAALEMSLKDLDRLDALANEAQKALDALRQQIGAALGGSGVAENKTAARLQEELDKVSQHRAKLAEGVAAMEQELGAIELRERTISGVLAEAVKKRSELEKHEVSAKKAKAAFTKDEERAHVLERRATQLDAIKKALLEAKQDIASEMLDKARPRAQALYEKLVRHPVFDTLDIRTTPKASKVDYTFEVSVGGASATARDARLILSDGQLTGAALALFFALAETTSHDLDVLYVDDPTQNLDLPSKEAMAKVVAETSEKRQVIVSTQDEDFVTALDSTEFKSRAVVHRITSWDGNPTVKTDSPR